MSADLKLLSIEDLEMLLCIQREKAVREAKARRLAEEVERAAAEAARKAEEEAAAKTAKVKVPGRLRRWIVGVSLSQGLPRKRGRVRRGR
jgi:hypothetical protein